MDFEKEEYTPMIDTKKPKPKLGAKAGNTQEFSSINGVNVKDKAAREDMEELAEYIGTLPPEPWQPLQDGYSNFWFELTNDTLSPWLNFSAKNADAVIDWGDGSGEVALDTLTPTHTYSKAGRYVVKVKGVTGLADCNAKYGANSTYYSILKNVECNSEITSLSSYAFRRCLGVEHIYFTTSISEVNTANLFVWCVNLQSVNFGKLPSCSSYCAGYCTLLKEASLTADTIGNSAFNTCISLEKLTISNVVESIGDSACTGCIGLKEIHCQATTPPTLGTNVFFSIASNFIIYVPVGTSETYKAASGWSTYADHILEEGQTPNRAMLAKFNSAKTDEPRNDMR